LREGKGKVRGGKGGEGKRKKREGRKGGDGPLTAIPGFAPDTHNLFCAFIRLNNIHYQLIYSCQ